jgi:hypothetical protein
MLAAGRNLYMAVSAVGSGTSTAAAVALLKCAGRIDVITTAICFVCVASAIAGAAAAPMSHTVPALSVAPVLQGIITGMKQFDDEGAQLSSLSELCELLSISTEESLTTFPIEQVVPLLVSAAAQPYLKAAGGRIVGRCTAGACKHFIYGFRLPRTLGSVWCSSVKTAHNFCRLLRR